MNIQVKPLQIHLDDRGYLYEILRTDDSFFNGFGQYYVSAINPGVVKGFHKHSVQTDYVACVYGQIKLVLIDDSVSPVQIQEYYLSPLVPKLVVIPPNIYHGWKCLSTEPAIVINAASHVHNKQNPDEIRIDPHENTWGYNWGTKDR